MTDTQYAIIPKIVQNIKPNIFICAEKFSTTPAAEFR